MVSSRQRARRWSYKKPLFLVIFVAAFIGAIKYVQPQQLTSVISGAWNLARGVTHHKELRFSGLEVLREDNLELGELSNNSVLWWHMNLKSIGATLRQNGLIREAEVIRCPDHWWNCFEVQVRERQPSLIAFVGERLWMVGDDGGFMGPVSSRLLEAQDREAKLALLGNPPLVQGLLTQGASPDLLKVRLTYVLGALETIKAESGILASEVILRPNGEMEIRPRGRNFVVIFGTAREDMSEITEESRRLTEILKRLEGEQEGVQSIDLAFNKRAVVKFAGK